MEFKSFSEIKQLARAQMQVTQKIHGSNAQVAIFTNPDTGEVEVLAGSRTRWVSPGSDNYGFAAYVYEHKAEFIEKLGLGIHFGEWAGPGINSGEGLSEKTFVLFDFWKYPPERPLPPRCKVVPVLYTGPIDTTKIVDIMNDLQANGSKLVPGYMHPEGVVVTIGGARYKQVFQAEETKWKSTKAKPNTEITPTVDYSHLCQPIRLQKVLSKDERLMVLYPQSIAEIVKLYMDDLVKEGQITGRDHEIQGIKKQASRQIFNFIREAMSQGIGTKHIELGLDSRTKIG